MCFATASCSPQGARERDSKKENAEKKPTNTIKETPLFLQRFPSPDTTNGSLTAQPLTVTVSGPNSERRRCAPPHLPLVPCCAGPSPPCAIFLGRTRLCSAGSTVHFSIPSPLTLGASHGPPLQHHQSLHSHPQLFQPFLQGTMVWTRKLHQPRVQIRHIARDGIRVLQLLPSCSSSSAIKGIRSRRPSQAWRDEIKHTSLFHRV